MRQGKIFDYYNFLYYNFTQSTIQSLLQSVSPLQYHTFVILFIVTIVTNIVQIDPSASIKILFSSSVLAVLLLFLFYSHGETDQKIGILISQSWNITAAAVSQLANWLLGWLVGKHKLAIRICCKNKCDIKVQLLQFVVLLPLRTSHSGNEILRVDSK